MFGGVKLAIEDEAGLVQAVLSVNSLIQDINDFANANPRIEAKAKIRFPTGVLRTAAYHRQELKFIPDSRIRTNLSYACMTHDVFRWLIARTTIAGQARDMVVKEAICLTGSVCEAMTLWPGQQGLGKSKSFTDRVARLRELEVVTEEVEADLLWVWEVRCREHLAGVSVQEWNHYTLEHWRRSVMAMRALRSGLAKWRE
ncbi:hypothetical protein RLDS_19470 [Sphingobium lactosutens DS20]|uniref:Uncharacterized protein n=1 Tax=Sphingobium lactosutens DS20 TaxID=1331060 RepID=T0IRR5_9SPHN|nr:hypothetical protein RLDS_19470 [Sphingobium lactosutens DS20]